MEAMLQKAGDDTAFIFFAVIVIAAALVLIPLIIRDRRGL